MAFENIKKHMILKLFIFFPSGILAIYIAGPKRKGWIEEPHPI
jgi:hypothetical protein